MVVICEECGLKYKIDLSKVPGDRARFKCKKCDAQIIVDKKAMMKESELSAMEDSLLVNAPTQFDREEGSEESAGAHPEEMDAADETTETGPNKSGFKLTSKVILLMLLVSLLPMAIYFALSFKQSNERIVQETNRTGTLVTALLSSEVDEWIDKNSRALKAIARMPAIVSMNQFDQEDILKSLQKEYPWMYLVFITDKNGLNVARSDGGPLQDYSDRQYFKDVIDGSGMAWQNLIGKTSKKSTLVLAVPIKNSGRTVGVLASAMRRDAISELVAKFKQGSTGTSFLVDQNNKVVAHQDDTFVQKQQDMSNHPLVQTSSQFMSKRVEFIDSNDKETVGFSKKTKLDWTLAIQQEKSEAFKSLKKAQFFAYSLFAVTVFAILIIAYFASRAIVTPIKKLTDAANQISVGDLDVEIINTSTDEIGDLADAVMRMQDSIRLSISRLKRRRR